MAKYKGCKDGVEMSRKFDCSRQLGKSVLIQILVMNFLTLFVASCSSAAEQTISSQPDLPQPTSTSPSPDLITEPTPTPTVISDELSPADLTAVNETQEAYEHTLLQTPSPTATLKVPLNENGPWLAGKNDEDLILMNLDGTGLTRTTIDTHWSFPWPISSFSSGKWLALETGNRPETQGAGDPENRPYNLAIQLLQLPPGQFEINIPLLSAELSLQIKQDERWYLNNFIFPLLNSPILWSPDGRYLAFVAALDGPSSDLYVYDTATDQIRRLTDGPNQAWLTSWSPDSQWILHAEATGFIYDHGSTQGHPITVAMWVASPDGSQVRKVHDVDNEITQSPGWLSPSVYVEQILKYTPPYRLNIRRVDIRTGEITSIYACFGSVIAITSGGEIIFWSDGYDEKWVVDYPQYVCNDPLPIGFYVLKDGNLIPLSQVLYSAEWNEVLDKVILKTPNGIEFWDLSGQLTMTLSEEDCEPEVSPDGQWLTFWYPCRANDQEERRIRIYSSQGDPLQEYYIKGYRFFWSPDSTGLYFKVGTELWFKYVQDGKTVLIHPDSGMTTPIIIGE
jgi:hypothetical protein